MTYSGAIIPKSRFGSRLAAFTLTELLISIGIVSILATLLWMGGRTVRQTANAAKCAQNLRQCGVAMLAYAGEHQGILHLYAYRTAGTSIEWLRYLNGRVDADHNRITNLNQQRPSYLADPNAAVCPAFKPFIYPQSGGNRTYGTATRNALDKAAASPPDTSTSSRMIYINRIGEPSRYWLLADSYHQGHGEQIYTISPNLAEQWGIHFRHGGKASVLFADGHVQMMAPKETHDLPVNPFTAGYDQQLNRIAIP